MDNKTYVEEQAGSFARNFGREDATLHISNTPEFRRLSREAYDRETTKIWSYRDNAYRGSVLGALLGAANGFDAWPDRWVKGLRESPAELKKG